MVLTLFFAVSLFATAEAQTANQEIIRSFDCTMHVERNAHLMVNETIDMDFGTDERHGLRRFIPVVYDRKGHPYRIDLHIVSITCDGRPAKYDLSNSGSDVVMKIGDPARTMTGEHKYTILYEVAHAINTFDGQPEIYWNATGNEWPFAIQQATAEVFLPKGIDTKDIPAVSFQGRQGSSEAGSVSRSDSFIEFAASDLSPNQGLTFAIRLPEGAIKTSAGDDLAWFLREWWPSIMLPLTVGVGIFLQWFFCGRDPGDAQKAGVEWNPPKDLSPAEVGTLVDESCDTSDIVSTLVDLAARGWLQIREIKNKVFIFSSTDYQFERTFKNHPEDKLQEHEKLFLAGLFTNGTTTTLSALKDKFYTNIPGIRTAIYQKLTQEQYFVHDPDSCRSFYYSLGFITAFLSFFMLGKFQPWFLGFFWSGLIILAAAPAMPARTKRGVDACRQAIGFKRFVTKAEKERIRVLAQEDPTIFGRLLPYAMVLGAADQWASAFKDLLVQPPDWYISSDYGDPSYRFNSNSFVNRLSDSVRTCGSSLTSAPSSSAGSGDSAFSSGGGSSGGGFGGGGGGSW